MTDVMNCVDKLREKKISGYQAAHGCEPLRCLSLAFQIFDFLRFIENLEVYMNYNSGNAAVTSMLNGTSSGKNTGLLA